MYIVTFEEFIKAIGEWGSGSGTFDTFESAADFMAFALKMGGAYYRDVKLWKSKEVEYRVDIKLVEN